MKQLQCNFTTIEQSKRLLELGVPADSADACYTIYNKDTNNEIQQLIVPLKGQTSIVNLVKNTNSLYKHGNVSAVYCWSVGRLIEIYGFSTNQYIGNIWYRNPMECIIADIEIAIENGEMDFSKLEE